MSGYSKTPLTKKLGIKKGHKCRFVNPFRGFKSLLTPIPEHVLFISNNLEADIIIWCCNNQKKLEDRLPILMKEIYTAGMIWVCWYKKASKKQEDVNEDVIRQTALSLGLVDIKVCAINDEWSGLKLVYRLENR